MEQRPAWEANRFSASQAILRILWNPNVYYHIRKSPPPASILSRFNPVHSPIPLPLRPILILSSHLSLSLQSCLPPTGLLTKILYAPLLSPIRATCPAKVILLLLDHPNNIWGVQSIKRLIM